MNRLSQPLIDLDDLDQAPLGLPAAVPPQEMDLALFFERFTTLSNEWFAQKEEIDTLTRRLKTKEKLDGLIEPYAKKAFWFMCAYCAFVAAVLIVHGFALWGFSLADDVLSLLVGSTAVTVIGLVGMVLTGVFMGARKH